ncbi:hypothetical protein Y013_16635 [Rhodococcus pyridinivorans SB3094]|uniref:Cell wall synthesis protein CwsA n=1 Tax=Rhodococcus pyridinivorans SB3094 TaxID=1435356 RepID=V9XPC7_9NOCA|nr:MULTISPECIES: hypothetical protein [Rhodococcus]AHD23835.1 hypothetical protein Y013_16635 [Rhodococcus pyridinivorans SB3094]MCT7291633.1 hypothetical protein [Rhodococcus sp. PAE-6]
MSKLIHAETDDVWLPAFVRRHDESGNLAGALRVAGEGAVALAQGSSAAGLFAARKGLDVAGELLSVARRAAAERCAAKSSSRPERTGRRFGLVVAGAVAVLAAGGVVFYRRRRPDHPPIAPEPPRVRPAESAETTTDEAASTPVSPESTDTSEV